MSPPTPPTSAAMIPIDGYSRDFALVDTVYHRSYIRDHAIVLTAVISAPSQPLFMLFEDSDPYLERVDLATKTNSASPHLDVAVMPKTQWAWVICGLWAARDDLQIHIKGRVFAGPLLAAGMSLVSPIQCHELLHVQAEIGVLPHVTPPSAGTTTTVILYGVIVQRR